MSHQAEIDRLRLEVKTLQTMGKEDNSERITISNYLLSRLEQLGVKYMFGVPGDFNLGFLDFVEDHPTIEWVGNCNELNAAYAADGYARVKEHSIGAVCTTFGVGELSAANGIAGAFSEMVPVLHIVGVPSTVAQAAKPLLHHTLGDGRYEAYSKAAELFTISQGSLSNETTAAMEIDRVLTDCITFARPVYLTLPTNMVGATIPSSRLSVPLSRSRPVNNPDVEKFILDEVVKLVEQAGRDIVILVDACAIRHDARSEVAELAKATGFPVYAAPMGKTAISECYERYGGIYIGSSSRPEVKEKVESAKLILSIGALKSDFNTGGFTYHVPTACTVEFHSDHIQVQYATFQRIGMKQLLPKLTARLQHYQGAREIQMPKFVCDVPQENNETITHAWFWPRVGKFFREKDVVVTETGTSNFGILDVPFPEGAVSVSQILWGSIGWSIGSTLGAALAAKDMKLGRTVLFVGDGSSQLTIQELSVIMAHGLKPIIFLLNNKGYTIERCIHGKDRKYNDITNWQWTALLNVLGDMDGKKSRSYTLHNKAQVSILLDDPAFQRADKIQLVEVLMDKYDAPKALKEQAQLGVVTH